MRVSLKHFAAAAMTLGLMTPAGAQQPTNPIANPGAEVVLEHARFTVLTPELIRMEWSADGKFEDHASFVFLNRNLPVPEFTHNVAKKTLTIHTNALTLSYTPKGDGRFTADDMAITLKVAGKDVVWHPNTPDAQNLLGTTRTLDGALGEKTKEPIEEGLVSRAGWAVVDDSKRPLFDAADFTFKDGEKSVWPWAIERPAGDRQDLYFFGYGHNYRQALGDYVKVAGRIPLPPRYAFGAWWSRYWAYSDQELDELVAGFRENDVPLDVLVIDMDWHLNKQQLEARGEHDQSDHDLGWSGYTWNKVLFPDPDQFLARIKGEGLKATLNLHPASGVEPWETAYPAMAQAMGIDPATKKYVPFDITDKKFAQNYFDLLHHPLEQQGIDFWWLDWQQEQKTRMAGVMPTWWLNYTHFTDQQREGKRPLLFHRWGGLGNHRYQIGFSGDTVSVWPSLSFQPWFTATAANVGYAYWSHDIGGHMPGAVDPELYTRWVEFGAYSPILRTHTTKNPESERRIWAYPEPYAGILKRTFQQRYAMEPYLYTEARRTYDTGIAFLRPLYYDWPEANEAYTAKNEYLFGDKMIVAPVTTPVDKQTHLATEKIWLPEGEWIETATGKHLTGPTTVERRFSIEQTPVYVRAGAIVPEQPPMLYTGQKPVDPLIVNLWPMAKGTSDYAVYEDDGHATDYEKGVFARTPIHATAEGNKLTVEVDAVEGGYPQMPRERGYELRLPADWPPVEVTVDGHAVALSQKEGDGGWRYDGNTLTTIIPLGRHAVSAKVVVEVVRDEKLVARRAELDGFAGRMTRLRSAYDGLNQIWPMGVPSDNLIASFQTGYRLSYHPEHAGEELAAFPALLERAKADVAKVNAGFGERMKAYVERMKHEDWMPADMDKQQTMRLDAMSRAAGAMADSE